MFDVLDGELTESAETMAKALREHLEDVLEAQDEVGRMHLDLEKLALGEKMWERQDEEKQESGEEILAKREKGVEEIMKKVSCVSLSRLRPS